MRRTDDPKNLEFIADADSLSTLKELDTNRNGIIDPAKQPSLPGDLYGIADVPALQWDAFVQPSADPAITVDSWGAEISGYAPIFRFALPLAKE